MNPRLRRLHADLQHMSDLAQRGTITFRTEGLPPDVYHVMVQAPGLARDAQGGLVVRNMHRFTVYLHLDYPRRPPVLAWSTPVLHPNILPPERNGGVCIGAWSAGESLADLIERVVDLVTYRSFNVSDALDPAIANWVQTAGITPGHDLTTLVAGA
jgi:ubiquitin-protein ligase